MTRLLNLYPRENQQRSISGFPVVHGLQHRENLQPLTAEALEERILELEYAIERLYAGKSEPFKRFCIQSVNGRNTMQATMSPISPKEQADFQRACETLAARTRLMQSLQRQNRARLFMRRVRTTHIVVACIAVSLIIIHVGIAIIPAVLYRLHLL